MRTRGSFLLKI